MFSIFCLYLYSFFKTSYKLRIGLINITDITFPVFLTSQYSYKTLKNHWLYYFQDKANLAQGQQIIDSIQTLVILWTCWHFVSDKYEAFLGATGLGRVQMKSPHTG